jgi:hypothetical protein
MPRSDADNSLYRFVPLIGMLQIHVSACFWVVSTLMLVDPSMVSALYFNQDPNRR